MNHHMKLSLGLELFKNTSYICTSHLHCAAQMTVTRGRHSTNRNIITVVFFFLF